ncbi:transposase domain protein [Leptospira santarosai str. CBC379]|nr:transposase domain protein [Leptospira santarosai str. CBC379]
MLSPDFVKSFRLCYFRRKKMESQDIKYVGIDCGKKSLEVVRINSEGSLKERRQFSTTEIGINNLLKWLTQNDIVGLVFLACKEPLAKLRCSLAISLFMNSRFGSRLSIF